MRWYLLRKFLIDTLEVTRLNDPRPTFFLFFPCCWGLLLANAQGDNLNIYAGLFAIACLCMYVTGCITNDFIDRDIDILVPRTKNRPLASRSYNAFLALLIGFVFGMLALRVLLVFNQTTMYIGITGAIMAIIYPFTKRVIYRTQTFLGLTANIGVLVGYSSVQESVSLASIAMYIGGMYWTSIYDTMYGYQDKEYDKRIGIKSIALLYGDKLKPKLKSYATMMLICFVVAGVMQKPSMYMGYYVFICCAYALLINTIVNLNLDDAQNCYRALMINTLIGFIITIGCYIGRITL